MAYKTGLICPDDIPESILQLLRTPESIEILGRWLFLQLVHQKEYTGRRTKPIDFTACDHTPVGDFMGAVRSGMLTDDDGHGYYADEAVETNIRVRLAGIRDGNVRKEWTHVCWYNK